MTKLYDSETQKMSYTPEWCQAKHVTQTITLSTEKCSLNPKNRDSSKEKQYQQPLLSYKVEAKIQASLQCKLEESSHPEDTWIHKIKSNNSFNKNDKKIKELLAKKSFAHQAHLIKFSFPVKKATFQCAWRIVQCKLRKILNEW